MRKYITFITCLMIIGLAGCSQNNKVLVKECLCFENIDKNTAMLAAEKILAEMYFNIEKADPQAGIIITEPLAGAQFFEFWRKDNQSAKAAALANLQTIRRTATLNFKTERKALCVTCKTSVERLALPEPREKNKFAAFTWFSSDRAIDRLSLDSEQKKQLAWIDLGPDKQLESKILAEIAGEISPE